jgi:cell division protein ZapA (FtsZ GTPase activity inhibitor)
VKNQVIVNLLSQRLTLRSDGDEEYVGEVAGFVNDRIQEVCKRSQGVSALNAALLTCLNIADELFRHKKSHGFNASKAAKKVVDLIALIEHH